MPCAHAGEEGAMVSSHGRPDSTQQPGHCSYQTLQACTRMATARTEHEEAQFEACLCGIQRHVEAARPGQAGGRRRRLGRGAQAIKQGATRAVLCTGKEFAWGGGLQVETNDLAASA